MNVQLMSSSTGIGLRSEHYLEIVQTRPAVGWLEVHSENYFGAGGKPLYYLEQLRPHYPLSFHGVGLSLGSTDELAKEHLAKLRALIIRFDPVLVSEHLCWSSVAGRYLNDLLPLPYTEEALKHVVDRVAKTQEYLQRQILIENISSYLQFTHSPIPEQEFLVAVAQQTGCGILLDINNLYVNSINHGWDAQQYLQTLPRQRVQEIHLAGFTENNCEGATILIDTHNKPVAHEVWQLYRQAITQFGSVPTLIEWDKDLPPLSVLLAEAQRANAIREDAHANFA